jgi:DNA-binding MarR family transcriptional regulator
MTKDGAQARATAAHIEQQGSNGMDEKARSSGPKPRAARLRVAKVGVAKLGVGKPSDSSAAVDLGDLEGFVGFHLRVAQDASFRAFARLTGQHGVKPGRFAALMVISRNPGIGQAALGQTIGRDKSSITPLIQELQRLGLIERRGSLEDRRRVELYLTAAGARHLVRLRSVAGAHDAKLDAIVGARKGEFIDLLRKLASEID